MNDPYKKILLLHVNNYSSQEVYLEPSYPHLRRNFCRKYLTVKSHLQKNASSQMFDWTLSTSLVHFAFYQAFADDLFTRFYDSYHFCSKSNLLVQGVRTVYNGPNSL